MYGLLSLRPLVGAACGACMAVSISDNVFLCVWVQGAASDGDKFSVRGDGLVTVAAGGLSVTLGGATIGGGLTSSSGLTITAGGLLVAAGGVTVSSSVGTNTLSTSATGSPAIMAASTASTGYTSSVLSVSAAMSGAATFYLIKVWGWLAICCDLYDLATALTPVLVISCFRGRRAMRTGLAFAGMGW